MHSLSENNENRSMMKSTNGDNKMDKSSELNASMTIHEGSRDEYEQTLHNIGGSSNE